MNELPISDRLQRALDGHVVSEPTNAADGTRQSVHLRAGEWVAECIHGSDVWTVHRGTEYLAWRSLRAHTREHPEVSS